MPFKNVIQNENGPFDEGILIHYLLTTKIKNLPLKTCLHCNNLNHHDDASCTHCGKRLKGDFGFLTYLQMTGVLMLAVGGFFFWPLWIVALITATTIKVRI